MALGLSTALPGGQDAEAELRLRSLLALSTHEGYVDFGQDNLPSPGIPRRDFSVGEDGLLLLVFLEHEGRPAVLDPAIEAAMIDGSLDPCAQQASGLAIREAGG